MYKTNQTTDPVTEQWQPFDGDIFEKAGTVTVMFFAGEIGIHEPTASTRGHELDALKKSVDFTGVEDIFLRIPPGSSGTGSVQITKKVE